MNNFILTYNPFGPFPGEERLLNHVQIHRHIDQYYQPYPGTFIFKSNEGIATLNNSFLGLFQSTPYLVIMFTPLQSNGVLSQEAWNWINTGWVPPIPPASPTNLLANALEGWTKKNP